MSRVLVVLGFVMFYLIGHVVLWLISALMPTEALVVIVEIVHLIYTFAAPIWLIRTMRGGAA